MTNDEFVKELVISCKPLPGFRLNNSHIVVRCPNCEAHRDPSKHGHLYINIVNKSHPFDCKKCDMASSMLTVELLRKLTIEDFELLKYVTDNHKVIHNHTVNLDERNKKLDYTTSVRLNNHDNNKLKLLNERLCHVLTEEEMVMYKVIPNFSKFMKKNGILVENLDPKDVKKIPMLDEHYIGFLSFFGNIISFRNFTGGDELPRYVTLILDKSIKRSYLYIPSVPIDPLTTYPKIVVAEGAIDIIAIHLKNKCFDNCNTIYAGSSSQGSFRRAVKNALSITGFFGASINMYLDNNEYVTSLSEYDFTKICTTMKGFGRNFKVNAFVNLLSKDFGDLTKPIKIGKICLNNQL